VARRAPPPRKAPRAPSEEEVLSLLELERFSQASLVQWLSAGARLRELQSKYFYALEQQRQIQSDPLRDALQGRLVECSFDRWARIVDYRYSLKPLSMDGSVRGIGGRFNIGGRIDRSAYSPFPALYIGEDYETAQRERFGNAQGKFEPSGLALRQPASFTHVAIRGTLQRVLDIGDLNALEPFVAVLRNFKIPAGVMALARKLGFKQPLQLIRTARGLQKQLLHPDWRSAPMQFDQPSNSQVFGRIAAAARVNAILYPSVRHASRKCLVLFPQNWTDSDSSIELCDAAPDPVVITRIDGRTRPLP
jgi:RES domain-containing protein